MSWFGFGRGRHSYHTRSASHRDERSKAAKEMAAKIAQQKSEEEKQEKAEEQAHETAIALHGFDRSHGPWDVHDSGIPDRAYADLGALKLPEISGMQVRLGVDESQRVMNAVITIGDSSLQLTVLAASRNHPIWNEVRARLSKGQVPRVIEGPFGQEVMVDIPIASGHVVPIRIVGVDGPRWMLRGIFSGAAAQKGSPDYDSMNKLFRSVVVDRGQEPVAPMDMIPLTLPEGLQNTQEESGDENAQSQDDSATQVPSSKPNGPLVKGVNGSQTQNILQRGDLFSEVR